MLLDGLIAIFFLFIGLEIRLTLTHIKEIALPAISALGGMVFPALIYLLLAQDGSAWATAMPTDIALVLGVVALLGKRISQEVRFFLLALAVTDDLLSLIVLAFRYSDQADLFHSAATVGSAGLGIVLGSISALKPQRLLKVLAPISTYFVIPVYVVVKFSSGISLIFDRNLTAFILARVFGKVIGITLFAFMASTLRIPLSIEIKHVAGIGWLCGMGLTVSLVIAEVAVSVESIAASIKSGLVVSALISALVGYLWFRRFPAYEYQKTKE